jgi:predicted TIM-barrel fold metal-dependent hydrolase
MRIHQRGGKEVDPLSELIHSYLESKAACGFFDCNRWHVISGRDLLHPYHGIETHLQDMAAHSIQAAVITNAQSIQYQPEFGNEALLALIAPHDCLYGSIVWSPEIADNRANIRHYLERMIRGKTVVVRMFPRTLRHSMKRWQVGEVLEIMEALRLPLMLWHMETCWDAVHEICERYPNLPVIVEGNDQKLLYHNRSFIPLLKQHPNLYIETHNVVQHEIIDYLINEANIDRLIFGTYFPYNDPDSSMMMVTHADIPEASKRKLAGGHLRGLIQQIDGMRKFPPA